MIDQLAENNRRNNNDPIQALRGAERSTQIDELYYGASAGIWRQEVELKELDLESFEEDVGEYAFNKTGDATRYDVVITLLSKMLQEFHKTKKSWILYYVIEMVIVKMRSLELFYLSGKRKNCTRS